MYGERAFATVVGALVVGGLTSGLGRRLEIEDPVPLEVKL